MNNYKVIRTIYENVFQRILECKDNDTGALFYSNIITSQKVMNLINIGNLKSLKSNIIECYNTEDRIFIFTKPLDAECRKLREYANNSLTLKQQFNLTEKSINLTTSVFNMTDIVQQKILDLDRLYIDENNDIVVDLNLIFEQEYDIADSETFKRLGNIIHMIFSGTDIIDYNISDTIPPDILKIIVRCLTREYTFPNDALIELKKSSIYEMIFGEIVNEVPEKKKPLEMVKDNEETDDDTLNIYLEGDAPVKTNFISKDIKRAAVSLLIVVLVLLTGNAIIKKLSGNEAEAINNVKKPPQETPSQQKEESEEEVTDSTEIHFNQALLDKTGYTGVKAVIDKDIYVEGNKSLLVANEGQDKVKSLFAVVDFTDENFKYMQMKQIGISAKIKSQKDLTAQIVFEAYKDGVIKSNFHAVAESYDDIWSPVTIPINVTDAELLRIYLEFEGENKVWIDSLTIDVIK